MSVVRTATTLAAGVAYRASGAPALAWTLIDRSRESDEDTATIAKMMLTRRRAVPHLRRAVAGGRTDLVEVLVSIATPEARAALEGLCAHADPRVAAAAREGCATMDRIAHGGGANG